MKLHIDDMRSFQSVQFEFNQQYPFLKIDFHRPFTVDGRSPSMRSKARGSIDIKGTRAVSEVVKDFEDMFKWSMVLLRRSGNVWIEAHLTVDWTLERQNKEGKIISDIGKGAGLQA